MKPCRLPAAWPLPPLLPGQRRARHLPASAMGWQPQHRQQWLSGRLRRARGVPPARRQPLRQETALAAPQSAAREGEVQGSSARQQRSLCRVRQRQGRGSQGWPPRRWAQVPERDTRSLHPQVPARRGPVMALQPQDRPQWSCPREASRRGWPAARHLWPRGPPPQIWRCKSLQMRPAAATATRGLAQLAA